MKSSHQSGQALLIFIMLGIVLLVGIAVVVFINQVGTVHQTGMSQRSQGQSIAEEGIAYAIQQFSISTTTWQNTLQADFTGTPCNTGNAVTSPTGGQFRLYCSTGTEGHPDLQPYEVAVTVVGLLPNSSGVNIPTRAILAYLAQRTLGADLASGVHAHAAMELVRAPTGLGKFDVQWGSVVCLDSAPWQVTDLMDTQRYPRKFSSGDIIGQTYLRSGSASSIPQSTDLKEYWARASLNAPPLVDEEAYQTAALNMDNIPSPKNASGLTIFPPYPDCPAAHPQCGYFKPAPGDKIVFNGGYSVPPQAVIFVDGPAEFMDIAIDSATFIVTSTLSITNSGAGNSMGLHVPNTAPEEYPYAPVTPTTWPCSNLAGHMAGGLPDYSCDSASSSVFPSPGAVYFRGFLYVKGDLIVTTPDWNMVGALLVGDRLAPVGTGGRLTVGSIASLHLVYDDQINHEIKVSGTPLKLTTDMIRDVPVF